ncbi:uncharacterized protein zgc:113184 [Nerophis ophidion]|uniref:uncharacterized protein zgc:113184 n=1 Tax=Nerophis ophidion TaxID=159077 RepID=UPI002ADF3306|nr:uncharacterized protein zgc:113184 [Nerophis ophidion]XP_061778538.1 uncharacterized protein zgc:113184 [Nerophis ophidion]
MEDAYRQLHQEFVCLRSLCLRQAALLHQLIAAGQTEKGDPDGVLPVRCLQEIPFQGPPNPAPPSNLNLSRLLTEDLSKFCLKSSEGKIEDEKSSNQWSCDPRGAAEGHQDSMRMLRTNPRTFTVDLPSLSGRLQTSDVTLQSDVCDFCQAVFPGHTTTRGDFLQHLHNHVT